LQAFIWKARSIADRTTGRSGAGTASTRERTSSPRSADLPGRLRVDLDHRNRRGCRMARLAARNRLAPASSALVHAPSAAHARVAVQADPMAQRVARDLVAHVPVAAVRDLAARAPMALVAAVAVARAPAPHALQAELQPRPGHPHPLGLTLQGGG
jgi:hypothetical protein